MDRSLQWDIFCKVIDNYGDIGVCWRLSADLAARGQQVRLWVDDASALEWMAPGGAAGIEVRPWPNTPEQIAAALAGRPCDVLIESFACEVAPEFIATCAREYWAGGPKPLWINLEYLSAEPYVARCHGLPSPVLHGPAAGWTKWFFYPGFTSTTGGLLREAALKARLAAFKRRDWLDRFGIPCRAEHLVSLFCYEPPSLMPMLEHWAQAGHEGQAVRLLVAAGRAEQAAKAALAHRKEDSNGAHGLLSVSYLPWLTQADFDHLLWTCDLNFVRGEDSVLRALWAGKPFVWQIYPQQDDAHLNKLEAFLEQLQAPASLRTFHRTWNQAAKPARPAEPVLVTAAELDDWGAHALAARSRLQLQDDLTSRLLSFARKSR